MIRRDFLKSLLAGSAALSTLSIERMAAAFDEDKPEGWLIDGEWLSFPFEMKLRPGQESRIVGESPAAGAKIFKLFGNCEDRFPRGAQSPVLFSFGRERSSLPLIAVALAPMAQFTWLPGPGCHIAVSAGDKFVISASQPGATESLTFSGVLLGRTLTRAERGIE